MACTVCDGKRRCTNCNGAGQTGPTHLVRGAMAVACATFAKAPASIEGEAVAMP